MRQESPTLDLANDCSLFVTRHFEIISTSSPHIYHSALTLTPRESIVRKLYQSHAQPFVRVVCGLSASWDSKAAASSLGIYVCSAVWSPCNRFIAIGSPSLVSILDSATLQRIQCLNLPNELPPKAIAFSPGVRMLTAFVGGDEQGTKRILVSWDLQTGGVVSTVEWEEPRDFREAEAHITYSMDGAMVATCSHHYDSSTISIHDVISGISMPSIIFGVATDPDLDLRTSFVYKIWTHGESFRFATPGPTGITVWEARSGAAAIKVEGLSVPRNSAQMSVFKPRRQLDLERIEFHPASYRLAFIDDNIGEEGALIVWDARASESLLYHTGIHFFSFMSFSPDARVFACTISRFLIYLWKESPTGYILFEKLAPDFEFPNHSFSPNGQSIIAFGDRINLWHTKNLTATTSSISTPAPPFGNRHFLLEFLPNGPLAVFTRMEGERVTVLDLKSGAPRLTINTPMDVYGLRSIENTILVIGDKKAIVWNLPGGNFLPDVNMDVAWKINPDRTFAASISPDFQCATRLGYNKNEKTILEVYYPATGQNSSVKVEDEARALWFTPGRHDIWCATWYGEAHVFTYTQDALKYTGFVANIEDGQLGCPWGSQLGYRVTDGGWILGESGKRLLMLPSLWQSRFKIERVWSRSFLALLHGGLPEPVILELEP